MGVFTTSKQFALEIDMPGWWLAGSSVDMDFVHGRYFDSSLTAPAAVGSLLSISRASIGYAKTSSGTLTQFASGQLRITDLGLLIEDARTNLVLQSQTLDNASWFKNAITVTADQAIAPDGTVTMDQLNDGVASNQHFIQVNPTITAGATLSYSVFLKDLDRRYALVYVANSAGSGSLAMTVDLQTGVITQSGITGSATGTSLSSASLESFANGTYRALLVGIVDSASVSCFPKVALSDVATPSLVVGGDYTYTGSNKSIYAWGGQLEQASFASSYIPTTTTSATRAADAVTAISSLSTVLTGSASSVLAAHIALPSAVSGVYIIELAGASSRLRMFNPPQYDVESAFDLFVTPGSGLDYRASPIKVAYALDGVGRSGVAAGGTVATDANPTTQTGTIYIGSALAGTGTFINGYLRRLTAWNTRLADATLQALTAP